jgi:hypothetical protein
VVKFKEQFWIAKRKINCYVAGNVGYCPTLPLSAVRHLLPPHVNNRNRSYTKLTGTVNIILSPSDSYSHAHSKAVYWTTTNLIIKCILRESLHACKNFDFLITHKSGSTLDATHCTRMATGHNSSSVAAEHNSSLPCKTATPVSPRERHPELRDLSDISLPFSKCWSFEGWPRFFRLLVTLSICKLQ